MVHGDELLWMWNNQLTHNTNWHTHGTHRGAKGFALLALLPWVTILYGEGTQVVGKGYKAYQVVEWQGKKARGQTTDTWLGWW